MYIILQKTALFAACGQSRCAFLMLLRSFRSCGGNGSLGSGTGALLLRLLGGKGKSGWSLGSA